MLSLWRFGFHDGRHGYAGRGTSLATGGYAGGAGAERRIELRADPVVGPASNLRLHDDLVLEVIFLDIASMWGHLTLQ